MTCDHTCDHTCPDNCQDECRPLSENAAFIRDIDNAVAMLCELDANIPDDVDYSNVTVTVNAGRIAAICDLLLSYADLYESVDIEELMVMNEAIVSTGAGKMSNDIH